MLKRYWFELTVKKWSKVDNIPNSVSEEKGIRIAEDVKFEHVTVVEENGPTCTIFPRDCADSEIISHWITAKRNAFVSLDSMQ